MSILARTALAALALFTTQVLAAEQPDPPSPAASKAKAEADKPRCEHGVQRTLCTRCNPKLVPVFKSKGDWCAEHERPESQCVLCHPELAKAGVK